MSKDEKSHRFHKIGQLQNQRNVMIEYLKLRLELCDWHGVQDAASDIREIEAALKVLQEGME